MVSQEDNQSIVDELNSKIVQQIEYYFSDINLSRDKFMKDLLTKDDGWISFDVLMTFNRLKSLTEDKSVVINALKDSKLLEISECQTKIRRPLDRPLPVFDEKYTQDLNERTLHIKGFPADTKLDDVMAFCQKLGVVENIEMRRQFKTRKFKGCIFVTFLNKEDAEKVINDNELKYQDNSLLKENKVNYFLRKKEFSEKRNNSKKSNKQNKNQTKSEEMDGNEDEEEDRQQEDDDTKPKVNVIKQEGAVLRLKGLDDKTKFSDIKKLLQEYAKVAYVEDVQQNQSLVRFEEKDGAKTALEKAKSAQNNDSEEVKIEISGKEVVIEVLTGDEELQYWTKFERNRTQHNKKLSQKKKEFYGKGGRKGKNMWQRGRKRGYKGSGDRNGKRVKAEDSD